MPGHRAREFRKFLDEVERNVPVNLDIHVIMDNASSHTTKLIRAWFAKRRSWHVHFTPTSSSWINQVERFFALLSDQQINVACIDRLPSRKPPSPRISRPVTPIQSRSGRAFNRPFVPFASSQFSTWHPPACLQPQATERQECSACGGPRLAFGQMSFTSTGYTLR
jgi:DDE superfamily endonuclease